MDANTPLAEVKLSFLVPLDDAVSGPFSVDRLKEFLLERVRAQLAEAGGPQLHHLSNCRFTSMAEVTMEGSLRGCESEDESPNIGHSH